MKTKCILLWRMIRLRVYKRKSNGQSSSEIKWLFPMGQFPLKPLRVQTWNSYNNMTYNNYFLPLCLSESCHNPHRVIDSKIFLYTNHLWTMFVSFDHSRIEDSERFVFWLNCILHSSIVLSFEVIFSKYYISRIFDTFKVCVFLIVFPQHSDFFVFVFIPHFSYFPPSFVNTRVFDKTFIGRSTSATVHYSNQSTSDGPPSLALSRPCGLHVTNATWLL